MIAVSLLLADANAEEIRESRLAMGTVVGITVRIDDGSCVELVSCVAEAHAAIGVAFATIERWEATLSEWRPDSDTSTLNGGGIVRFDPLATAMLRFGGELSHATGGAFDLMWAGGRLAETEEGWRVDGGRVGLGALLKGFLVDRAAEAVLAAGRTDFVIDAAGDVYAHGSDTSGHGWSVSVRGGDGVSLAWVRLRDEALSTSGDDQQPGHIRDPRTGAAVTCSRTVTVIAPTSMVADGVATALYAGCGTPGLAERHGAWALRVDAEGERQWTRGARGRFRAVR